MFWIILLILTIFKLFLAGKDATSYLLRGTLDAYKGITKLRIDRWHRDGAILDLMFTVVTAWASGLYLTVPVLSLLIRLSIYDLAFNKWAGIPLVYLGSTSRVDRFFSKIFGVNGAVKKSAIFFLIVLLWGIIKTII